jgi:fumarate hydratase class II
MPYREESDTMGKVSIPKEAYYGPQTQRALENFPVSELRFQPIFIRALSLTKKHAARVNMELGLLDPPIAETIIKAAHEVSEGSFDDQFAVDIFQTGSGTSTNMNINEVIAGRANEILTGSRGGKSPVHPNDHVNMGQSSNDVIPSAIHMAALIDINQELLPSLNKLQKSLEEKADEFSKIMKIARTHLQDAVPITLGQEFSGYARQIKLGIRRIESVESSLSELALGGTAVGTGLNTHPEFAQRVIQGLSEELGYSFREANNHFEAQAAKDAVVETSGALRTLAVSLTKIANDIRWLSSGPRGGLGEIEIPALQPGSSIMPGKVNPVIGEAVLQVAAQIMGNDLTIILAGQSGNFELNVMMPVMAYNLLQSIHLMSRVVTIFEEKCVRGIIPNKEKCVSNLERNLTLATAFVPAIGYDKSAALAKEAYATGRTIRDVALRAKILPEEKVNRIIDQVIGEKSD